MRRPCEPDQQRHQTGAGEGVDGVIGEAGGQESERHRIRGEPEPGVLVKQVDGGREENKKEVFGFQRIEYIKSVRAANTALS